MRHEDEFDELVDRVDREARNYSSFDPTMGMDDDDSVLDFDPTLGMDDDDSVLSMVGDSKYKGLAQYDFRVEYVNGGGGLPVNVTLFQTNNNPGVVVGNTLTFTNGVDSAIVRGDTASFIFFQNELITKPFQAEWFRMNVVDAAQFSNVWTFNKTTAWGGVKSNTINPNAQLTPEQFQLLRVDIATNFKVTSNQGISFDLGPTELAAAGGTRISIRGDAIMDPARKIARKSEVMRMKPSNIGTGISEPTAQIVAKLAKIQSKQIKAMPQMMARMARQLGRGR